MSVEQQLGDELIEGGSWGVATRCAHSQTTSANRRELEQSDATLLPKD